MKKRKAAPRKITPKHFVLRTKGNMSAVLIFGVLFLGLIGGGLLVANNTTATTPWVNNVRNNLFTPPTPTQRQQLQLETFYPSPAAGSDLSDYDSIPRNNFTNSDFPPGTFPTYPPTPYPTLIISSSGCTYTIGFWKNHAGFGPQSDALSPLLPIWLGTPDGEKSVLVADARTAVTLLQKNGDASNGVNKLYAQMLGSLLNIKSGADDTVLPNPATADFLAKYDASDWGTLSSTDRDNVIRWAEVYDEYNNGRLGPSHCP